MTYIAGFTSIDGVVYDISFQNKDLGSGTRTLTLSDTPLIISMKSDGKNVYAPLKTSGATISILASDYDFDLYSGQATGTKVKIYREGTVIWVGYLTPCIYNMGYDEPLETVELEAIDGLAVLKNLLYKCDGQKTVETFGYIIFQCLKQSDCFRQLYISDNVQLSNNVDKSVIDQFRISQQNWFKKKKDITQTDDDVAYSCYDVLKELMQWLGYTMYADGEDVYVIDYDSIKHNPNSTYYVYDLNGDTLPEPTTTTKIYTHNITATSYSENGTNVELDEVYNKCTVKDEYYTYDNLIPEFGDVKFEKNITSNTDIPLSNLWYGFYYHVSDVFKTQVHGGTTYEPYMICVARGWYDKLWIVIAKQYSSSVLDFIKYDTNTLQPVQMDNIAYSNLLAYHGAFYMKYWKREIKYEDYEKWRKEYDPTMLNWYKIDEATRYNAWCKLLNKEPEKISLTPIISMVNQNNNHIGPAAYNHTGSYDRPPENVKEDAQYYPYIRLKTQSNSSIFGGDGAYLIIKGSVTYHSHIETPFPLSEGADNSHLQYEGDYKYSDEGFLWARIKWGSVYWNGEEWQDTPCDFKLRFWKTDNEREDLKNKNIYDKAMDFIDTAQSEYGCSEKGVYIPAPESHNLSGSADMIIYANRDMWGDSRRSHWGDENRYQRYYSKVMILQNFSIKAYISNGLLDDKGNDSDTVYTNVINNGSVNKMSDITFKVTTWDNKKPNYSSVDFIDSQGNSHYVCKTINKALINAENGSFSSYDNKAGLTQEEHMIFKLVKQYETPKVKFTANLKYDRGLHKLYGIFTDASLGSRIFIIDEYETDYKNNQTKLKLIEKS